MKELSRTCSPEALAVLRRAVLLGHAGRIAGTASCRCRCDVRAHPEGGGAGAAQADLLLGRECDVDLCLRLRLAEPAYRLDAEPAGDAVVERLGYDLVADLEERFFHHHHVAHRDVVFRRLPEPEVDEEFMHLGNFLSVFGRGDVHRPAAGVHHPDEVRPFPVQTRTRREKRLRGSKPPHGQEAHEALVGDVGGSPETRSRPCGRAA